MQVLEIQIIIEIILLQSGQSMTEGIIQSLLMMNYLKWDLLIVITVPMLINTMIP